VEYPQSVYCTGGRYAEEGLDQTPDSPYRNADGTLSATAQQGEQVFLDKGCDGCHSLPFFTDSGDASNLHDIGTLLPSSGNRLGGPLPGIDTPTLLGVWRTPPYLHDGRAQDISEAITAHAGIALTAQELSDLSAYLLELDDTTGGTGGFVQDGNGILSIEAEHFTDNVAAGGAGAWLVLDPAASGASNTQAIKAAPGGPTNPGGSGPHTTYQAELNAGQQYVWMRFRSFGGGSDSFFFQVGDGAIQNQSVGPDDGAWRWIQLSSPVTVAAQGVYTLTVYRREKDIELDKLVMTTDPGFDPATVNGGAGPGETIGAGSGGNTAPVLAPIGQKTVSEGVPQTITMQASDANASDTLSFDIQGLPTFTAGSIDFTDNGDGTAVLDVSAGAGDAGDYPLTVTVMDDGDPVLSDDETFTLRVVAPGSTGTFLQDSATGLLVAEAEHFTGSGAGEWVLLNPAASGASNAQAIKAEPGSRSAAGTGPYVEYEGEYSVTGTLYVWLRFRSFGGGTDSFFYQFAGGSIVDQSLGPDDGSWHWLQLRVPVTVPAPGTYSFRIYRREQNVEIDKIILTPDAAYAPPPNDVGDPESARR
jgi:hypothetical protein